MYKTLYETETARGVVDALCVDCAASGGTTRTIHPLRLCRQHFADRYSEDERKDVEGVPTWDDTGAGEKFRRYGPGRVETPTLRQARKALGELTKLAEMLG